MLGVFVIKITKDLITPSKKRDNDVSGMKSKWKHLVLLCRFPVSYFGQKYIERVKGLGRVVGVVDEEKNRECRSGRVGLSLLHKIRLEMILIRDERSALYFQGHSLIGTKSFSNWTSIQLTHTEFFYCTVGPTKKPCTILRQHCRNCQKKYLFYSLLYVFYVSHPLYL